MYTVRNFRTKRELRQAVARGEEVRLYAPGLRSHVQNRTEFVAGPHSAPHTWYAQVILRDGAVVKVK